jgi:hypothetical protein
VIGTRLIGTYSKIYRIYAPKNTWHDVQLWAKENTPVDSVFITPLDKWSHYMADFDVFSNRSTVVTLGELFEIVFHPQYINT